MAKPVRLPNGDRRDCYLIGRREGEIKGLLRAARKAHNGGKFGRAYLVFGEDCWVPESWLRAEAAKLKGGNRG